MKNVINLKNTIILILIIILLYYLIVYNNIEYDNQKINNSNPKVIESMNDNILEGNLSLKYSKGFLYKRIDKKIDKIFKKLDFEIIDEKSAETEDNTFKLFHNIEPVGAIRYFPYKLENNNCWLRCDGNEHRGIDYPELYRFLEVNKNDIEITDKFTVPNLNGRIIFGIRQKSFGDYHTIDIAESPTEDGPFMNTVNNSNTYDNHKYENASNLIGGQIRSLGSTDGFDYCPESLRYNILVIPLDSPEDKLLFCHDIILKKTYVTNSFGTVNKRREFIFKLWPRMPPYIALYPYIKAKTLNYKFKFPINEVGFI